jgi:hypothetical protein
MPREIVSVALTPEDAQRLRVAAAAEDRTLSSFARLAIRQALREHDEPSAAA